MTMPLFSYLGYISAISRLCISRRGDASFLVSRLYLGYVSLVVAMPLFSYLGYISAMYLSSR